MAISVLIVDDEKGMRSLLRKIVEKVEGYEVVGEATNGEEGIEIFFYKRVDVVFIDIEMPSVNGVECAKRILDIEPKTIIVFATAFSDYMDKAFELYAFDYLLKPFKVDRVFKTLEKIKGQWNDRNESLDSKLVIKNKEQTSFVDKEEIILLQREDSLTAIYTINNKYTTSMSLAELEGKLPKNIFLRCHKSYIVNLNDIESIQSYGRWTYIIKLKGIKQDALITKERYGELKDRYDY